MSPPRRLLLLTGLAAAWPHAAWAGALGTGTLEAGTLGGGGGLGVSPWRVIASLGLCLALGAAAILVLRRRYGLGTGTPPRGPSVRRIRVIEQHGLGPQRSLSLIEIDRRTFAALTAPGAATLVALPDLALSEPALAEPALSEPGLSEPGLSEPGLPTPAPAAPAPPSPNIAP